MCNPRQLSYLYLIQKFVVNNSCSVFGSSPTVGSSNNNNSLFWIILLAKAIRWRSPPENLLPVSKTFVSIPSGSSLINLVNWDFSKLSLIFFSILRFVYV